MSKLIDQILDATVYDLFTDYEIVFWLKGTLKEITQEIILRGLSRAGFCMGTLLEESSNRASSLWV